MMHSCCGCAMDVEQSRLILVTGQSKMEMKKKARHEHMPQNFQHVLQIFTFIVNKRDHKEGNVAY